MVLRSIRKLQGLSSVFQSPIPSDPYQWYQWIRMIIKHYQKVSKERNQILLYQDNLWHWVRADLPIYDIHDQKYTKWMGTHLRMKSFSFSLAPNNSSGILKEFFPGSDRDRSGLYPGLHSGTPLGLLKSPSEGRVDIQSLSYPEDLGPNVPQKISGESNKEIDIRLNEIEMMYFPLTNQRIPRIQCLLSNDMDLGLGYIYHPCVLQWLGYSDALKLYLNCSIQVTLERGVQSEMAIEPINLPIEQIDIPVWLPDQENIALRHRAMLLMKELDRNEKPWYQQMDLFIQVRNQPDLRKYFWPFSPKCESIQGIADINCRYQQVSK